MLRKYSNRLILFGILFLEITGTFAENNKTSSDIQIRKKRVINPAGAHHNVIPINEAGYIVNIARRDSRHCVGSIMMPDVIITVAHCVEHAITQYQVFSGSRILGEGSRHSVSNKIVHENYNPRTFEDDVALLVIHPLIHNSPSSHSIQIYQGTIYASTTASIIAWGCPVNSQLLNNLLQEIRVPIIRHPRCTQIYENMFHMSERNICAFDTVEHKRCGVGDFGAPLVLYNQLIGMYIWSGPMTDGTLKPDVFVNLNHQNYRQWIRTKLHEISLHL